MYKRILFFLTLTALVAIALFVEVFLEVKSYHPFEYFESEDELRTQSSARFRLAQETIELSPHFLQKRLSQLDGNKTIKDLDSYNILFAISDKDIFVTIPTPYIYKKDVPDSEHYFDKIDWLVDTILDSPINSSKPSDIRDNLKIKSLAWVGKVHLSKLNRTKRMIFISFKRDILDKALADPSYKKNFQHYVANIINHESIHLLGEEEYLATKYGEHLEIDSESAFLEDFAYNSLVFQGMMYYTIYEMYNSFFDSLSIGLELSEKQKQLVGSMLETLQRNKDEILIFNNKYHYKQYGNKNRASWSKTHKKSFYGEYYEVLTRGEKFLDGKAKITNSAYWTNVTAGEFFNIYHLFKEKGYTQSDVEFFNSLFTKQILDFIYTKVDTNDLAIVQAKALESLNILAGICFETKSSEDALAKGIMYSSGNLVKKDYIKAKKYLLQASQNGSAKAKYLLGDISFNEREYEKAISYYEELNDSYSIGRVKYKQKKYEEAYKAFSIAAQQKHTAAKSDLGLMYVRGQYVKRDYKKAMKLFNEAMHVCEFEYITNNIALLYLKGLGVEQNTTKALELLKKAADLHLTSAVLNLNHIYQNKLFGVDDTKQAERWKQRVSELSQEEIEHNYEEGFKWD